MTSLKHLLATLTLLCSSILLGQNNEGHISGNFQARGQYYNEDSLIGAQAVPEQFLLNGFANINYTKGKFRAGLRYENYTNPLLGFPPGYVGSGIAYKYAGYEYKGLDITLGNFYEQFGSGLILRSWEDRTLGYDNAFEGIRMKYSPVEGLNIKALYGNQRINFALSEGVVRAVDAEAVLNQLLNDSTYKYGTVIVGASVVSKFQPDNDPTIILPENVSAVGARIAYTLGGFDLSAEYVEKVNDPSKDNNFIYANGRGFILNAGYSQKGLGLNLGIKSVNNMSFRSDRNADLVNGFINYIPATNKQHTYNLAATLYPYACQPNGEFALTGEIFYKVPKKSLLGGKYGLDLALNFTSVESPFRNNISGTDSLRRGFTAKFEDIFKSGGSLYYQDFNFEVKKKINKQLKATVSYINLVYNEDISLGLQNESDEFKVKGSIRSQIWVADLSYKISRKHSIRTEFQHLETKGHRGNWATALIEYTFAPHWFVAAMDQYNYGNPISEQQIHYYYGTVGYINKGNRFTLGYGRQRAGVFCVGGVCRQVPASNGFSITVTSTF